MSKKEASVATVQAHITKFQCPICHQPLHIANNSLCCEQRHTFDFAKQGYVNFVTNRNEALYTRELFASRHKMIEDSQMYDTLHQTMAQLIAQYSTSNKTLLTLDAGCGEGTHLQKIMAYSTAQMVGVGIDIAKEGVKMAAANYGEPIWLVADLANTPLQTASTDVIINILSPSNYKEFERIAAPQGIILKVVPNAHYLQQLRTAFMTNDDKKSYSNADTIALFEKHYTMLAEVPVTYDVALNQQALRALIAMTPLTQKADAEAVEKFIAAQDQRIITIDLTILVGTL